MRAHATKESLLKLFDLVGELARKRFQMADQAFMTIGLNHTEARLLTLLSRAGGSASQDHLSNQMYVDRTNSTRALQKLEKQGYVVREKSNIDKRANSVVLTAKGRKSVVAISRLREAIAAKVFGDLSNADAEIILKLLS